MSIVDSVALQAQKEVNECSYDCARAKTILLVEDQDFVRRVTGEVLRAAGYAVLSAKNAIEALCIYDRQCEAIELLLTDIVLPGESGRELARKLRCRDASLKVLFVTGYGEQIAREAENEAKNEELLAKPFSTAVLLRRITELLGQHPNTFDRTRYEIRYAEQHQSTRACDIAQPA